MERKDKSVKKRARNRKERRTILKQAGFAMMAAGSGLYGLAGVPQPARIVPG